MKIEITQYLPLSKLILLDIGSKRSKRLNFSKHLNFSDRFSNSLISIRIIKRNRITLNNNIRKTRLMRNKFFQRFIYYLSKILLEIQYNIDVFQNFHNIEIAKFKRLKSAQNIIKECLPILQKKIINDYRTPEKDEYEN
jgi:hypothetical protein